MIKTKSWTGGTDEEYETQHFGFGSQLFNISMRRMIEETITNGIKNMESVMQIKLDLNDTDKLNLTKSCDKLIRLYCKRAEPSMHIIEEEFEQMLKIPPNILLPEDEVQLKQISDDDYEKLNDEIAVLRKRVERAALMEALLTVEDEELSLVDKACEVAKKDMDILDMLHKSFQENDQVKTIQSRTNLLCKNVQVLKSPTDDKSLFEK